jgi:hypothetical protein
MANMSRVDEGFFDGFGVGQLRGRPLPAAFVAGELREDDVGRGKVGSRGRRLGGLLGTADLSREAARALLQDDVATGRSVGAERVRAHWRGRDLVGPAHRHLEPVIIEPPVHCALLFKESKLTLLRR